MKPQVIISKQTLLDNVEILRKSMPDSKLYLVVKGNGYGFGLEEVAVLLNEHADGFCVGLESEAITLSMNPKVSKPILLMSPVFDPSNVVAHRFIPSIERLEQLHALEAVGAYCQTILPYHIKIETGLHRFGFHPDRLSELIDAIKNAKTTKLEGVFSHFQNVGNTAAVHKQLRIFSDCIHQLETAGISVPLKHIANGEAAIDHPETRMDLVRVGNALFGKAQTRSSLGLKRPDHLEVPIVKIQNLPSGKLVGYSGSFKTKKSTRIGLIPFGFDHGLQVTRNLAPLTGKALIRSLARIVVRYFKPLSPISYQGKMIPLLGREYMQFATIDLSAHPEVQVGDKVQVQMSSFFINPEIERIYK